MRKTETLGLPIYDAPETDLFKFQDWNEGNQKIDNKIKEFSSSLEQKANKSDVEAEISSINSIIDKVVYVDRKGVDNTGVNDISDFLNALIVEVNSKGGGVIQFGRGYYRLNKQIIMLPNVILRGNQKWRGKGRQGYTVLQCYNKTDVQFLLRENMRIENFWIEYPEQVEENALAPIEYNWTFSGVENNYNDDIQLNNIYLKNSYKGINATQFGRCNISDIYGQPLMTGIKFVGIRDMIDVRRIEFWTFNYNVGSNMFKWVQNNGTAFELTSLDGGDLSNLFAYGYKNGFLLNGECWATLNACSVDKCRKPIVVEDCNIIQFIGGAYIGSTIIEPIVNITKIRDSLTFTDCNFFGGMRMGIINKSTTGKLVIKANFKNTDNKIGVPLFNSGTCPTYIWTNEKKIKVFGNNNTFVNGVPVVSNNLETAINFSTSDLTLMSASNITTLTNGVRMDLGQVVSGEKTVGFNIYIFDKGVVAGLYLLKFNISSLDTTSKKRFEMSIKNGATYYNGLLWDFPVLQEKQTMYVPIYLGKSASGTLLTINTIYYDELVQTNDFLEITDISIAKMSNPTYSTLDYLYNNTFSLADKPNYTLI